MKENEENERKVRNKGWMMERKEGKTHGRQRKKRQKYVNGMEGNAMREMG